MIPIDAVSMAPTVRDWLANSNHPRFLHVFDHACNLINERGEVLSIVTPKIGNGPFNLVLDDDILFPRYINVRSPISVWSGSLDVGALKIGIDASELWRPRPDWQRLYARRHQILYQLQQFPIAKYQSLPSNLTSALANANICAAKAVTTELAGLGIGLTPAGDDFLLGAVLAAWIIHPRAIARKLANAVTGSAAPRTTSLSAAWLLSAGRGEAGILWHAFFEALVSADRGAIQETLDALMAVGHTSGADALAGFFGTFVHWAEKEQPHSFISS